MGCTTATLKFSVITLNILCAVFGALMIAASVYCLHDFPDSELIQVPCMVSLALGSTLFLTVIPGCSGPLRESVRGILIYTICVWILMCGQIIVNLVIPLNFDRLAAETINNAWRADFLQNGTMAAYETKYSCCGKFGPQDYPSSGLSIPLSCYKNQNSGVSVDVYTVGCIEKVRVEFESSERIEFFSDWTLVGVEFVTGLLAGMLAINLKNAKRRKQFH